MEESIKPMNRRSLLQRGAVFIAGILGLEVVEPRSHAEEPLVPKGSGQKLRLYARRWQTHAHGHEPGELPSGNGRLNRTGVLLTRPDGQKEGEFYATCFCPAAPFGGAHGAAGNIELHSFHLRTGSLFGIGSANPALGTSQLHAIVGGTGRFAGARGSYAVNRNSNTSNGDNVEIVITILT
jgi:hypothetical protein